MVYTSWLSRAIETGLICLNELDTLWVPVTKTWRLNERMYGALTGLSKKMIRQIYGRYEDNKANLCVMVIWCCCIYSFVRGGAIQEVAPGIRRTTAPHLQL